MEPPGILTTARTLAYYTRLQALTANNLANVSTNGFKASRMTAHLEASESLVPVTALDLTQGAFQETGRPLDVALDGPGFFLIETPRGTRLSRGGSLRLDADGRLTDTNGNPLQGELGAIALPPGQVRLHIDGSVHVDDVFIDRLRIVRPEDPEALQKEGAGQFVASGDLEPVDIGATKLRQGTLEEANVDPIRGLIELITMQRAYGANLEALRVQDAAIGTLVNDTGKV